uniref:Uncharacterized protein n=1 Tax=Syphacia muris TaxID=451379 RepID=A0A0N5B077_9BILA
MILWYFLQISIMLNTIRTRMETEDNARRLKLLQDAKKKAIGWLHDLRNVSARSLKVKSRLSNHKGTPCTLFCSFRSFLFYQTVTVIIKLISPRIYQFSSRAFFLNSASSCCSSVMHPCSTNVYLVPQPVLSIRLRFIQR